MLNMLRSDLYRILHIRSFKIGVFIMSIMTICLTMPSVNVMSNTAFANYDAQIGNFAEYLYYFPKSAIFMIIVMLMYVIYLNEKCVSVPNRQIKTIDIQIIDLCNLLYCIFIYKYHFFFDYSRFHTRSIRNDFHY